MSGMDGRPRRPWRTVAALAALTTGALGLPLAVPAGAAEIRTVVDCEPEEGNPLQEAFDASVTGDTVVLADEECFSPDGDRFEMPVGQTITFEGADLDPGAGVRYPALNGSLNDGDRILRAHDVQGSVIRNLTFRLGDYYSNGGAIKVQGDSAPTIDNVVFEGNRSGSGGGAVSVRPNEGAGTVTIRNSVFRSIMVEEMQDVEVRAAALVAQPNSAPYGGAIYVETSNPIVIADNVFEENEAEWSGGAVHIESSASVTISGNTFEGNTARFHGGGVAFQPYIMSTVTEAGGVAAAETSINLITDNEFTDNAVEIPACYEGSNYGGGGLSINSYLRRFAAAVVVEEPTRPTVTQVGNTFTGNRVEIADGYEFCNGATPEGFSAQEVYYGEYYGGGEMVVNAEVTSRDDRFVANTVSNVIEQVGVGAAEGGGISVQNFQAEPLPFTAHNLVLAANRAEGIGVGGGGYVGSISGGVDLTLLHATVVANTASAYGGGLAGGDEGVDDLVLQNSILWGNTAEVTADDAHLTTSDYAEFATVTANFSDVCEDAEQPFEAGSGNNICADPKLVNAASGDVHQTATSPTLDAASAALTGSLDKDYEGQARNQDSDGDGPRPGAPDMGADETPAPVVEEPKVEGELIAPGSIGEDDGYCQAAQDGGVFTFGGCQFFGAAGGDRVRATSSHITAPQSLQTLNAPIVSIAMQPSDTGYWQAATDGGVFSFGTAPFLGSMGGTKLNNPIVGIATSPTGQGYYLVASDGGVFSFGDAPFLGSMGGTKLNKPIVGIAATPTGKGYWLVASDGGIFSFGDAKFHGSTGGMTLNSPIVGMASRPGGLGYWLAAADGGVFTFGDAPFLGNRVGQPLNAPITGIKGTSSGLGYWLIAGDGGIFSYGSAPFLGSMGSVKLNQPVVDMTG